MEVAHCQTCQCVRLHSLVHFGLSEHPIFLIAAFLAQFLRTEVRCSREMVCDKLIRLADFQAT